MNFTAPEQARFLVRKGSTDWMVYDRELKGPAQLEKGGRFAEKLTKEQAERIKQALTDALPAPAGNARVWRDRLHREVSAKQTANK
ncbi:MULTISPECIES: hypothetical protein [unclassified Bradyrhizobium]|uniref:hypothetical protein n=1 Tax=unclassified Bradyrhizobium TaxID=2631580 RepID=UPI0020139895|nr:MULTISPECIES: hypothetical protein [unclassified Bradyrhizobium]